MNERNVIVASSSANIARKFTTRAGTWGDIQPEILAQGLKLENVEAILKPGNLTLSHVDSVLPAGDFKIYLVPTKNKAGLTQAEAQVIGNEITQAIIKAADMASSDKIKELKVALIGKIEEFYDVEIDDNSSYFDSPDSDGDEDPDVLEARRMANRY